MDHCPRFALLQSNDNDENTVVLQGELAEQLFQTATIATSGLQGSPLLATTQVVIVEQDQQPAYASALEDRPRRRFMAYNKKGTQN